MTTNTAIATETLRAQAATQATDTLMGALLILETKGNLTEAERLVQGITSDVVMERHGLVDALDALLFDADFDGSYTDALVLVLAQAS